MSHIPVLVRRKYVLEMFSPSLVVFKVAMVPSAITHWLVETDTVMNTQPKKPNRTLIPHKTRNFLAVYIASHIILEENSITVSCKKQMCPIGF